MTRCQLEHLLSGFVRSLDRTPDASALVVDGAAVSYSDLAHDAGRLARIVMEVSSSRQPFTGLLAARSRTAYAGVLGILAAGRAYMPLNPRFPAQRNRTMLEASGVDTLIVDENGAQEVNAVLNGIERPIAVICPDRDEPPDLPSRHRAWFGPALAGAEGGFDLPLPDTLDSDVAYLLFTSGSTGRPKGVPVAHANVCAYLDHMGPHVGAGPGDRCSQNFDLTFDLSVHDLFVAWWGGSTLVCTPQRQVMAPARHIREHQLTMWFSVPSVIQFMIRMRLLKPGVFPTLRRSLFCGEPLTAADARQWRRAAPNSTLENLYGPTEATIAFTGYRWDDSLAPPACRQGLVPLGTPFPGQRCAVVDEQLRPVAPGESGELCLSGSQVTAGYLDDAERTVAQFVCLADDPGVAWYRTGDRVCADPTGSLHFLGRLDHQVQVLGHRVELQEIEHVLREASGSESAVAVPWPKATGRADCIHAFVAAAGDVDVDAVVAVCRARLPEYMVPAGIHVVAAMPLNGHGKIDRGALARELEALLRG